MEIEELKRHYYLGPTLSGLFTKYRKYLYRNGHKSSQTGRDIRRSKP